MKTSVSVRDATFVKICHHPTTTVLLVFNVHLLYIVGSVALLRYRLVDGRQTTTAKRVVCRLCVYEQKSLLRFSRKLRNNDTFVRGKTTFPRTYPKITENGGEGRKLNNYRIEQYIVHPRWNDFIWLTTCSMFTILSQTSMSSSG